jgi:thiol:disulfide interchange protein DsbD
MTSFFKLLLVMVLFAIAHSAYAQHNPVTFTVHAVEDTLIFDAQIEEGWHLYAANLPDPTGGPLPTEFVYNEPAPQLKGAIVESEGHVEMDESFGVKVKYFEDHAFFKQGLSAAPSQISGTIYYMVCNDEMCIPLEYMFNVNP